MWECENCGSLYFEPEITEIPIRGIFNYEEQRQMCPYCQSIAGHDWATWHDADDLLDELDGLTIKQIRGLRNGK